MFLFRGKEKLSRSFAKAVSWRALGSVDTFLLGLFFTGSAKAAGSIAATEVITKIFLYTGHERAWEFIKWGRNPDAPAPTPQAQADHTPPPP